MDWIKSFLSARVQNVIFNGVISAKDILVSSGVPQGSHLGPILFNLFINDLPSVILHSSVLMYADDVKIFSTVDPSTHGSPLQEDFNRLCVWCDRNGLALNCAKCKIMSFSRRSISQFSYCLGNTTLERVQIFCDLGITMDIRLRYDVHINLIINKAKGVLAVVKRWAKEFNDPYVTKLLYTSLVRPILEYGSPLWNPKYNSFSDRIESAQKQFLLFALRNLRWRREIRLPPYSDRLNQRWGTFLR